MSKHVITDHTSVFVNGTEPILKSGPFLDPEVANRFASIEKETKEIKQSLEKTEDLFNRIIKGGKYDK